jgi:hypothetical protein
MVGLSKPEKVDNGGGSNGSNGSNGSDGSNGSNGGEIELGATPEFDLSESSNGDGGGEYRDVEFGEGESEMLLSVPEAVELAGEMLTNPEQFGIASEESIEGLETGNETLREAVAELAEAVEALSGNQADMAGVSEPGTVLLDGDAFGEIYEPENGGEDDA